MRILLDHGSEMNVTQVLSRILFWVIVLKHNMCFEEKMNVGK